MGVFNVKNNTSSTSTTAITAWQNLHWLAQPSMEHTVNHCMIPLRLKLTLSFLTTPHGHEHNLTHRYILSACPKPTLYWCSVRQNSCWQAPPGEREIDLPRKGSFRTALSWKCSTSSLKVNGASMISFIHLLSSGLMMHCRYFDIFQVGWMFESQG